MKRAFVKRWYFWVVVLVLLAIFFLSIGLIYSGQGPINQANFDRVQEGMTEDDVTAILGKPSVKLDFLASVIWQDGPDVITVYCGSDGKVSEKAYTPPTAWQRLRWHAKELLFKVGIGRE